MAERRVPLTIDTDTHAALRRRAALDHCTLQNVVVAACREWIGERQRGRVGHGGSRLETSRDLDAASNLPSGPTVLELRIGVNTCRGVEERANRHGLTLHTAINRSLREYLGLPVRGGDEGHVPGMRTEQQTPWPVGAAATVRPEISSGTPDIRSTPLDDPASVEALVTLAQSCLAPILDRSGNVLYSGAETLRPGSIYLLGLNPGGDPTDHILRHQTIGSTLAALPTKHENEFLDVSWRESGIRRPPGEARLQRRVRTMLERLGLDPRHVCAANLIFARSRDAATSDFQALAPLCWPVHEAIIQMVQPRLIVSIGTGSISAYGFLRALHPFADEQEIPSGHGDWMCRAFATAHYIVAGVPHLGRYAIDRNPTVTTWLKGLIG